jgi:hypothetical protein
MNRRRVGEDRGSKETDGCPLTDRGQCDEFLELHEEVFLGQAPDEPNVLHGQVEECTQVVGKPRNKASV